MRLRSPGGVRPCCHPGVFGDFHGGAAIAMIRRGQLRLIGVLVGSRTHGQATVFWMGLVCVP